MHAESGQHLWSKVGGSMVTGLPGRALDVDDDGQLVVGDLGSPGHGVKWRPHKDRDGACKAHLSSALSSTELGVGCSLL